MNERNEQMAAMLAADAPAARDLNFELAVMARIEQRAFRRGVAINIALAAAGAMVLALAMPGIEQVWQQNFAGLVSNAAIAVGLFTATLMLQWWVKARALP